MAEAIAGKKTADRVLRLSTSTVTVSRVRSSSSVSSTPITPSTSEVSIAQVITLPSTRAWGMASPGKVFPAALASKENPSSLPSSSMTASCTLSTPPIASQVSGFSSSAQTVSLGASTLTEWEKVLLGTGGKIVPHPENARAHCPHLS